MENKVRLEHIAEKLLSVETLHGDEMEKAFTEPFQKILENGDRKT